MADDDMGSAMAGGCLCGALRYEIEAAPRHVTHCHCRMCQRASGAAVLTWAAVPREQFRITKGAPGVYASSDFAAREFCPGCGGQLFFRYMGSGGDPGLVYFTVGSLDDPARVSPEQHIWTSARLPWLHMADGLPEHEGEMGGGRPRAVGVASNARRPSCRQRRCRPRGGR